jgi:hypothetical protein
MTNGLVKPIDRETLAGRLAVAGVKPKSDPVLLNFGYLCGSHLVDDLSCHAPTLRF